MKNPTRYSVMPERLSPLISLPFILSLGLLLLNDFFLKGAYHNVITGKLSDICGLFIFSIFWSSLLPKYKAGIFISTALLFIYWKSGYSQSFIEFFSRNFFQIERTVDSTDLLTLPVLVQAWFCLKGNMKSLQASEWQNKLNPYLIAAVSLFSFYSTSKPRDIQRLEQPQYILLNSEVPADSTYFDGLQYYKFGSLLVVRIDELSISQRPAKNDDYNKNKEIKNLDQKVSQMLGNTTHLITPGQITSLQIKASDGEDDVTFNGGRLDGKFIRKKNGKIIIEGLYKMGIEDSVWIFRNSDGQAIREITFVNGERTKIRHYKNNTYIKSEKINTRADTIRNKGIQISVLILLLVSIVFMIITNRRKSPQKLKIQTIWKWLLCLSLPLIVCLLLYIITLLLDDFNHDIFAALGLAILIYFLTCPLFFIIVFWIKPSKQIDILWYSLIFALCFSIWIESDIFLKLLV
ncbi:toxin-antitoxin system YwqK family antitoxin [Chryseobacterium wangxinyae]|uniref:toxin-antitoxin system YwqK family antitoxin n=1 Tax=Chryseobacterium sp. CY353 TaxID=2997334 RepID=UPI00226F96E3|nr:hypothetical protein [Chryseobacterium sp. CY353]MCY0970570.1 hypothetical protein [Chryseobacterium sp. CY353]